MGFNERFQTPEQLEEAAAQLIKDAAEGKDISDRATVENLEDAPNAQPEGQAAEGEPDAEGGEPDAGDDAAPVQDSDGGDAGDDAGDDTGAGDEQPEGADTLQKAIDLITQLKAENAQLSQTRQRAERTQSVKKLELPQIEKLSEEDRAELVDLYPGIDVLLTRLDTLAEQNETLQQEINSAAEERAAQAALSEEEKSIAQINKAVHNAETLREDPKFYEWLDLQTPMMQRAIRDTGTVSDIVHVLKTYNKEMGIAEPKSDVKPKGKRPNPKLDEARAASAPNVPSGARQQKPGAEKGKMFSAREIEKTRQNQKFLMSPAGEKWQQEVTQAMAQGRIIQDN